jgi:hypothetical protein
VATAMTMSTRQLSRVPDGLVLLQENSS